MRRFHEKHGLKNALRLTPSDTRDIERPVLLRRGKDGEGRVQLFSKAAAAGADLMAIESAGGKEVSDEAWRSADLRPVVSARGGEGAEALRILAE